SAHHPCALELPVGSVACSTRSCSSRTSYPGLAVLHCPGQSSVFSTMYPFSVIQVRIVARTAGDHVKGHITHLAGVAAFLSRTLSCEVVRHFARSAWYRSVV